MTLSFTHFPLDIFLATNNILVEFIEHGLVASGVAVIIERMFRAYGEEYARLLVNPLGEVKTFVGGVYLVEIIIEFLVLVTELDSYLLATILYGIVEQTKTYGALLLYRAVNIEVESHHLVGLVDSHIDVKSTMLSESTLDTSE